MRLFHVKRLSDSKGDWAVHFSCYSCERRVQVPARELLNQYGDLTMDEVRQRAVCRGCKSRKVVLWEMDLLVPSGEGWHEGSSRCDHTTPG
jgi:hypothetical protein